MEYLKQNWQEEYLRRLHTSGVSKRAQLRTKRNKLNQPNVAFDKINDLNEVEKILSNTMLGEKILTKTMLGTKTPPKSLFQVTYQPTRKVSGRAIFLSMPLDLQIKFRRNAIKQEGQSRWKTLMEEKYVSYVQFISSGFIWSDSDEGQSYWSTEADSRKGNGIDELKDISFTSDVLPKNYLDNIFLLLQECKYTQIWNNEVRNGLNGEPE